MASLSAESEWNLRVIREGELPRILEFLRREPLLNVYLISRLLDEGTSGTSELVEVSIDRRTAVVASLSSNVVITADRSMRVALWEQAVALVADRIINRRVPIRATISDATLVEFLWKNLNAYLDPPTVVRLNQPVYALTADRSAAAGRPFETMRFAISSDLEALVPCCAAMHQEEVGIDPLERDALGYRERIRELIGQRRSLIAVEGKTIVFKCELSAVTPDAVQLMGVWTHPRYRREGRARQGLEEVCAWFLGSGQAVTLFVNDFNLAAIALYESLGFSRIGANRALIW